MVFGLPTNDAGSFGRRLHVTKATEAELLKGHTTWAWLGFWAVFVALAVFDIGCLAPRGADKSAKLAGRRAFQHCLFWFLIGLMFNGAVWSLFGQEAAVQWFDGYILEYLLSMDNVFFFHVVFTAYATPEGQVYKALFLGILGAVVLRLGFYLVGTEIFQLAFVVQIFFGLLLVYSGYKTATSGDDEEEDPRENRCIRLLTRCLPLTNEYDDAGRLFVKVQKDAPPAEEKPTVNTPPAGTGEPQVLGARDDAIELAETGAGPESEERYAVQGRSLDAGTDASGRRLVWRGTMLLLVALVLQIVDLIFAVDSVTAKLAECNSIFINFSSSAFAMLCLRSLYFVLTQLLEYFRFLKYGVAAILVLIGLKLMASHWLEIPSIFSLVVISGVFVVSIILSALFPAPETDAKGSPRAYEMAGSVSVGNNENLDAADSSTEESKPGKAKTPVRADHLEP